MSKKGIERSAARGLKLVWYHVVRSRVLLPQAHSPAACAYPPLSFQPHGQLQRPYGDRK
jgi:hypothetical protein